MSDTPYFDAYERRRRERTRVVQPSRVTISTFNAADTVFNSSGSVCYSTPTPTYASYYPKYRLQKTYTFIGDVRVVQDCFIESQASSGAEWVQVDVSFNAYSF